MTSNQYKTIGIGIIPILLLAGAALASYRFSPSTSQSQTQITPTPSHITTTNTPFDGTKSKLQIVQLTIVPSSKQKSTILALSKILQEKVKHAPPDASSVSLAQTSNYRILYFKKTESFGAIIYDKNQEEQIKLRIENYLAAIGINPQKIQITYKTLQE